MSFYHGGCAPHPMPRGVAPVSPVPSYQSSSQSGTTSSGSQSSRSESFRDYSVGSAVSPSSWLSPEAPFSYSPPPSPVSPYSNPQLSSPVSPTLRSPPGVVYYHNTRGDTSDGANAFNNAAQPSGESGANVGASTNTPDVEQESVHTCKSVVDVSRERGASMRALALLDATAGLDVKSVTRVVRLDETINEYKSEIETARERGSNLRALALLEATVGKEVSALARATSAPTTKISARTVRQAALEKYYEKQLVKQEMNAKMAIDQEKYGKRVPTLVAKQGKETLAESTRKPRAKTAEDIRDPDTVAGMKCQMDIDREKEAMKRALQLLSYGAMV